jgi:hypothetical protein
MLKNNSLYLGTRKNSVEERKLAMKSIKMGHFPTNFR